MSDLRRAAPSPTQPEPKEPDAAAEKGFRSLQPGEFDAADRMKPVHEERAAAAAQIGRTLKAWRSASGAAADAHVPQGGGDPLPAGARSRMERQLGANLGDVKIHTGGDSARSANQLGARAFTVGNDVHFNDGQFAPGSKEGDRLLAHELTHVVQGQKSGVQRKPEGGEEDKGGAEVSTPDEPAEQEADARADHVAENLHGGADEKGEDEKKEGGHEGGKKKPGDEKAAKEGGDGEKKAGGDTKEAAPSVGAKLARKIFRQTGGTTAASGNPQYPKTPEEYKAHIRQKFASDIAAIKEMHDQFKAKGGEALQQTQALKADGDKLNKLKEDAQKNAAQIKGLEAANAHAGKTQADLRKQAEALLKKNKDEFGTDRLQAQADKEKMEQILLASMALSAQIDPEGTGAGRSLYNKIDKDENAALLQILTEAKLPTQQTGELMSMYRTQSRLFIREEIMKDDNAREITYLRDLGISGHRTGPTPQDLLKKELLKQGVTVVAEATEGQLEQAWQGIVGSAQRTNQSVNATTTGSATGKT